MNNINSAKIQIWVHLFGKFIGLLNKVEKVLKEIRGKGSIKNLTANHIF